MDKVNLKTGLFIGKPELSGIQENTQKHVDLFSDSVILTYGIAKKDTDIAFSNMKVYAGSNPNYIGIKAGHIFDSNKKHIFLPSDLDNCFLIPATSTDCFIFIESIERNFEVGTVTISATGLITGVGTEFTKLRVGDFPSKIRFDSLLNGSQDFEVATVTSDTITQLTGTVFTYETGVKYTIKGTYAQGTVDIYPLYIYDDFLIHNFASSAGATDTMFLLAKVNNTGGVLTITDLRTQFLTFQGSVNNKNIGNEIAAASDKTPVDSDSFGLSDSENSGILKKISGLNLKLWLKSYFDTIYTGYTLTKAAVEAVLTGEISSHTHPVDVWLTGTIALGWTGLIKYRITKNNELQIFGYLTSKTEASELFTIPVGIIGDFPASFNVRNEEGTNAYSIYAIGVAAGSFVFHSKTVLTLLTDVIYINELIPIQ